MSAETSPTPKRNRASRPVRHQSRGFALIITITLLAFLVLLLVSLASMTRVETQVATNTRELSQARQNAIYGLQIAIGQLQKYAGADQRATFPATTYYPKKNVMRGTGELYDGGPDLGTNNGYRDFARVAPQRSYNKNATTYLTRNERIAWDNAIKSYWNGTGVNASRNPHWVGIMDSSFRVNAASNPLNPPTPLTRQAYESSTPANPTKFGEFKRDQLPIWLVSGNERFDINQETATSYPAGYYTPDRDILQQVQADPTLPSGATASDYVIKLVGDKSTSRDAARLTRAPYSMSATNAAQNANTDGLDGHVLVKKEPILTSATSTDKLGHYAYWVGDESLKANLAVRDPYFTATVGTAEYRNRLQVPQRIGWERLKGFDTINFDVNSPNFDLIETTTQIPFAIPNASLLDNTTTRGALQKNFHQLTGSSRSLLTDSALGGLKRDLSSYLHRNVGLNAAQPIADPNLYISQDPRFGANNTGFPNSSAAALDGIPKWGQIKTWHDEDVSTINGGTLPPSRDRGPVITYVQVMTGFSYDPTLKEIRIHWMPQVVLWNPYDVALSNASYDLDIGANPVYTKLYVASPNRPFTSVTSESDDDGVFRGHVAPADWNSTTTYQLHQQVFHGPDRKRYRNTFDNNVGREPGTPSSGWQENADFFYGLSKIPNTWNNAKGDDKIVFSKSATQSLIKSTNDTTSTIPGVRGSSIARELSPMRDSENSTPSDYLFRDHYSVGITTIAAIDRVMKFRITTTLAAGESRMFTLGTDPSDNVENWEQDQRLLLKPGLETQYPASAWFPMMKVAQGPNAGPNDGLQYELRWTIEGFNAQSYVSTYLRLSIQGDSLPISETTTAGYVQFNHINDMIRPGGGNPSYGWAHHPVSTWIRKIPETSRFSALVGNVATNTDTAGPAYSLSRVYLEPITSTGDTTPTQFLTYNPALSRFNVTRSPEPHPQVEGLRNFFAGNNADGLLSLNTMKAAPSSSLGWNIKWNEYQSNASGTAYSFVSYKNPPTPPTIKPLEILSTRNAKRSMFDTLSLGQLQQVNLSPYFWQPYAPIGNSDAGVYNDRETIAGINSRPVFFQNQLNPTSSNVPNLAAGGKNVRQRDIPGNAMVDMSYLLNESLWDRYFLSSIKSPSKNSINFSQPLPNSRMKFTGEAETASDSDLMNHQQTAAYLHNVGALNVNSTSVEAWKAILSAFRNLNLGNTPATPANTAPIARTLSPIRGALNMTYTLNASGQFVYTASPDIGATSTNKDYTNVLSGYRYLTDDMIQVLAERIVDEIKLRGPFLSLADFVNRRLVAPNGSRNPNSEWYKARTQSIPGNSNHNNFMSADYDPFIGLQGLNGALQRALNVSGINGGVNHPAYGADGNLAGTSNDRVYSLRVKNSSDLVFMNANQTFTSSNAIGNQENTREKHSIEPSLRLTLDSEHLAGSPVGEAGQLFQGTPGFVTQADLLAMIGPALVSRGDTFVVRTYGDAVNPATGEVQGRAWLEAIVQRTIDPVDPASTDRFRYTSSFGRRFKVVSFRWLNESDL